MLGIGRLRSSGRSEKPRDAGDLRPRLAQPDFLIEVSFQDIAHDGRYPRTFLAVFPQRCHHDLRIVARSEADEPGVGFHVFAGGFGALQHFARSELGGSGLAAHLDPGDPGSAAGAAFVYDAVHAVNHFSNVIRIEFHAPRRRYRSFFGHMRLKPHATDGESTNVMGELNGRYRGRALSDGHRDGLTRVPLLAEVPDLPFRGWHNSFGLVRQIDAGLVSQTDLIRILGDAIDTQSVADVIEEDVARLHDPLVQLHGAMATLQMAGIVVVVECRAAWAVDDEVVVDDAGFEAGQRHHGLEGRSWRLLGLNGAIQQRMVLVID